MVCSLKRLISSVRTLLRNTPDLHALVPETIDKLISLMEEVSFSVSSLPGLGMHFPPSPTIIFYMDLHHCSLCDVGLFLLPAGSSIPPHNHPDMTVFQKIISGRVLVRSLDWDQPGPNFTSDGKMHGRYRAHPDVVVDASTPVTYLSPNNKNIHSVTAQEPSVILDMLIPPYDEDHPCFYFEEDRSELIQIDEPREPKVIPIRIDLNKY